MSDRNNPGGNPDLSPELRRLILTRAGALIKDLLARFSAAEEDLEKGLHLAVLGGLVLAEIQLQHLRSLLRLLET